ncbi:hypothetical protein [Ligilactobacillus salivarius]|uniref:hypothetical protein n=1 Tax=Ligilactobacillus salivarius TaxID=1624 RepID=UPI00237D3600|nr:hypothetical protein [Ligilactobacillus salivarius]MDE1506449.1 hypothetical protein [Ligilactobacillus salivarius]MDE1521230.1 hypothetical protein [Ligilactobacillus salivarius]
MINPNIKRMLAELKHEFHEIYEVPYNGLYVIISDEIGNAYEDENSNFSEKELEKVDIIYRGNNITVLPHLMNGCEIYTRSVNYENLDVITKAVAIVGKHLKNIG